MKLKAWLLLDVDNLFGEFMERAQARIEDITYDVMYVEF